MKKDLLLFVFCLPLGLFAQNSFPLFSEKPSWRVFVESFQSYRATFEYEKDTVVDGKTYSKVRWNDFLVRNEGKKTFIRQRFWNTTQHAREFLLYDFDLRVGDSTFVGPNTYGNARRDSLVWMQVKAIDSVMIGNIKRKRLTLDYERCGRRDRLRTMQWVEGIGSMDNPFYAALCLCDGCEQGYRLICFHLDSTQIYMSGTTCDPIIRTSEIFNNSQIIVTPNPFVSQISIENAENVHKIEIYSLEGRLMHTISYQIGQKIDLSHLPIGLFLFHYFDDKNQLVGFSKATKIN